MIDLPTLLPDVRQNVPLAPYTTYAIGGPADWLYEACSQDELANAVRAARAKGLPVFVLGVGANVLVRDGGIRGLVIVNRAQAVAFEGATVRAESGTLVGELIELTKKQGLSGLEHFAGIPSTVGGALWQNLHFLSPDRERTVFIEESLLSAEILEVDGSVRTVDKDFFQFGYDESVLRHRPELIALSATFQLSPESEATIQGRIDANLAWRGARHPDIREFPSCGSVFMKIEGVGAGRLIEQAGLKGYRIGGAEISEKHANFIVNAGGATAADVQAMIRHVQEKVYETSGYRLETEINLVGED